MVLDHLGHGISVAAAPQRLVTPHSAILDGLARGRMGQRPFSASFIGGGSYSIPRAWAALDPRIARTVAAIDPARTAGPVSDFWFGHATAHSLHDDARGAMLRDPDRYHRLISEALTYNTAHAELGTRPLFTLLS